MIIIVGIYFVYLTFTSLYFIFHFRYIKKRMDIFNNRFEIDHVFNILNIKEDRIDLNIKTKVLRKSSIMELFLNSRYNPISKEINIFLIDDNMFDLVTINVAIHELCHYFLDKSKAGNEKNSILLKTLNIVTKLISMPSVIILLLTTIFRFFQFSYIIDGVFILNMIIIVSYFIIFYGFIITPLEYRVAKMSLKTVISMKIIGQKEIYFYKKMNILSLIGHIVVQILIVLLFVMIFIGYFFFRNKYYLK